VDKGLLPSNFNINEFNLEKSNRGIELEAGNTFEMGNRKIEVIDAPGHTDDHLCFYDLSNDYLFAGDLLYKGPLYLNSDNINLSKYINSLEKILQKYNNIKCILSSHYDPKIRVDYLKDIYKFILKLKSEGKYEKGTGVHKTEDYKIYL
jgi:glyoxylase-like metal-dependent hydrolase (beta-lactamase superfamily II)